MTALASGAERVARPGNEWGRALASTAAIDAAELTIEPYRRDELLMARAADGPQAEVFRYPGVAVVLGRGSRPAAELDLDAIAADRVPVLRRRGGGLSVVLDPGNLVVSLAMQWPGLAGIHAAYDQISAWLVGALERSGVPGVEKRGSSDLVLGDRKIGGACMVRSRDLVYYSTTLLHSPDLDLIDRYLQHPPREPDYRRGRPHRAFLTTIADNSAIASPEQLERRLRRELAARSLSGVPISVH